MPLVFLITTVAIAGLIGITAAGDYARSQPGSQGVSRQAPEGLVFGTGYGATSDGFRFAVLDEDIAQVSLDSVYVNETKVGFAIAPADPGAYCNGTTNTIRQGDQCLVTVAGYPGTFGGLLVVRLVSSDGENFIGLLRPGMPQVVSYNSTSALSS